MSAERQAVLQDLGDNVDRLCTLDLRPPGPTSGYIGRFYQAVRTLTDAPLTLTAAQRLHQITPHSTIVIATGFCHPERLPYGETDGPPGARSLSWAVRCELAYTPLIFQSDTSERYCLQRSWRIRPRALRPRSAPKFAETVGTWTRYADNRNPTSCCPRQ